MITYDAIYTIAAQGLNLEKLRIDVVANNIANQHTLQQKGKPLFQPQQVIAKAQPFSGYLSSPSINLVPQSLPPNKVYQPDHPAANQQGYLTYPGISTVDEMTTLLRAARAYEANIKIINTVHNLYLQSLTIGMEQ